MTAMFTLLALLSLPLPMTADAVLLDSADLARGFGAELSTLTEGVRELERLGLPAQLNVRLVQANGDAARDASVLAAWSGDRTLLHADDEGRLSVSLDEGRLDSLEIRLPKGVKAELEIPWLDELGIDARCPDADSLVRAAGC